MAEVTREMILSYMIAKGGVVKNMDLVRHFRKYLQVDDPRAKGIPLSLFVFSPKNSSRALKNNIV